MLMHLKFNDNIHHQYTKKARMEIKHHSHPLNTSFYKRTVNLALPISLQAVLGSALAIADVAMVGSLGDKAVAAVGLGSKLHFVTLLIMAGFGSACSVLIAQYVGAGKHEKIKETLVMTLITGFFVLLPIAYLFAFSPAYWLSYLTTDTEMQTLTANYLVITASSVLAVAIIMSIEASLRAISHTRLPLIMGALANGLNVFLNYVLIFGHFGMPEMGVAGAAWATLIARFAHALFLLGYLYFTHHPLAITASDLIPNQRLRLWKSFWVFSAPIVFNFGLWGLGSTIYHLIATRMGTEPLAVMSIITPIEGVVMSMFIGVGGAAAILLGEALGSDKHNDAWLIKNFFVRYTPILAIITGGGLWLLQPIILSPFTELDSSTSETVQNTYLLMCLLTWMKVHNLISIVSVLRSGGDNAWCLKLDITAMWIIGIPTTAITGLILHWPFEWVFVAMFSEEVIKLFGSRWRMGKKKWMNNLTSVVSA